MKVIHEACKRFILLVVLLEALTPASTGGVPLPPTKEYRKKLQGPPSAFPRHRVPRPEMAALESESMWREVRFTHDTQRGQFVWRGDVAADSPDEMSISILTPDKQHLEVVLQLPQAPKFSVTRTCSEGHPAKCRKTSGPFGIDGASYPVTTYTLFKPAQGMWTVELIMSGQEKEILQDDPPKAILMVTNRNGVKLSSHLNKYEIETGQELSIVARMCPKKGADASEGCTVLMNLTNVEVKMAIIFPNGQKIVVPMNDEGLYGDASADDGTYAGVFEALLPGHYVAQSIATGTTAEGIYFERSAEHAFYVVQPYITLTGLADVIHEGEYFYFNIHVDTHHVGIQQQAVKAYAEVWGTDSSGYEYAPVGYMEAIVDPESITTTGNQVLTLQIHENWMHKAGVSAPFQLRNVWVQDRDWNVVLSERTNIFVNSASVANFSPDVKRAVEDVHEGMLFGPRPKNLTRTEQRDRGTLILVHGYCSSENPFPLSDFDGAVQFQDFKQSRTTDQFALLIREFGEQYPAFSLIGHSHGGIASTHLHAYYWSNLENAQGGRLVQSVGTPYHGSGLAGNLGRFFGFGCGRNNDLTYDGANKWAAAIPESIASDVYYYTTQYKDAFLADYCVFGSSLVLLSPNDGTAELSKSRLQGAHDAGHKEGWCHTSGMTYPSQCQDAERNAEMNAAAAR